MKTQLSRLLLLILSIVFCTKPAWSQQRVELRNTYERLLCVVPMVGAGTYEDPRRPMYAPVGPLHIPQMIPIDGAPPDSQDKKPQRKGILAYSFVLSDDEQFALVEFVAASRSDFSEILQDSNVRSFIKGKAKRIAIETEFKKFKKDVDLDNLEVSLP